MFDIFLSPLVTRCLPSHTSCQHIAGIFPASSFRKLKPVPISTFCLLWKSLPAGCRTPSQLTRLRAGRLLEARDRRNCFGIDARGCRLFPGQGQFVPTRARHTRSPSHTFTHLEQTQDGFPKTHPLFSNRASPFCPQEPLSCKDTLLLTRNIYCPSFRWLFTKPADVYISVRWEMWGRRAKFWESLLGVMSWQMLVATSRLGSPTVSQRAGYGALPTGRGWPPPNLLLLLLPNPGHSTTSSAPNLKSKTATTALARETSSSPTLADCRWLDLWQVWFLRQAKCWHKQAPLMGTKGWSLLWTLGDQMHKIDYSQLTLRVEQWTEVLILAKRNITEDDQIWYRLNYYPMLLELTHQDL